MMAPFGWHIPFVLLFFVFTLGFVVMKAISGRR